MIRFVNHFIARSNLWLIVDLGQAIDVKTTLMIRPKLGQVLQQEGVLSEKDLDLAISEQKDQSILLGELLLQKGMVPKDRLVAALQKITRTTYVDCRTVEVDKEVLEFIPRELALKYCCLPLALKGKELLVAMAEPQNLKFLDELRFITGTQLSPQLGFQDEIKAAIAKYLPDPSEPNDEAALEALLDENDGEALDIEFFTTSSRERAREAIREFQAALRSKPTAAVRLVSNMITEGVRCRASDIHIDPQATDTVIRLRVDGFLRDLMQVPQHLASHLVSRIKILADLDIAERRVPQDGRFLVRVEEKKLDLRVSTLPTHYGEKVVMRLLDPDSTRTSFLNLGFSQEHSEALSHTLHLPQGLVLVCGPTGSGKTTTLYSALNQLCVRSVNIITVEDPIEYMLDGINQVQVNKKAGLTFAGSLRSILRQDPNIVMVGEIRDKETAEIALTAAQTGHLVLSTLHTNDSIASLDRLRDLGVPGFLIASSVTALISQRLLRKLCTCRAERALKSRYEESLLGMGEDYPPVRVYDPVGCEACGNTGYSGRIGVFEVVIVDDEIRRMIQVGAGTQEIRAWAGTRAIRFLKDDALDKVRMGLTSMDEVLRVVPMQERVSLPCQSCGKELMASFAYCPYCGKHAREASNGTTPLAVGIRGETGGYSG